MTNKITDILSLAADMESFIPLGDELSETVAACSDGELPEEDLLFVSAAGSAPSYESFLKRFQLD